MNLKENLGNYVIFHGPPFVGKSSYFTRELSETYKRISPNELFQTNLALSLRQLINNNVIKPLLKGEKVAVDDSMQTMAVRRSYTDTVLKKVPKIQCTCLAFVPEFGKTQLLWKREILLAEAVLNEEWHCLDKIFATDIDVWYEKCEPILDVEQLRKFEVTLPLQIYSRHPFQIPCLMIECRGLSDAAKIVPLMEIWFRQNKRGRFITIFESDRSNRNEVQKHVSEFLKSIQISSELVVFAYLFDGGASGNLTLMTASVLAFLMRLHCLDLFGSNSVYLYESLKHRKMVESVGMRHIKLARALVNPDLLRHGTTQFPIPKMLQSMRVLLPPGEEKSENGTGVPCVPLLQKATDSDNCIAKVSVGSHRTLYIAAQSVDTLNRYHQRLLEDPDPPACVVDPSPSNAKPPLANGRKRRLPSSSFKVLPSWMMRKRRKSLDQTTWSADGASRPKTGRGQGGVLPATIYIMTEQELLKTAKMIFREGGRTDEETDALAKKSLRDGKLSMKEEKLDQEEDSILHKALDEKATQDYESVTTKLRPGNARDWKQHTRASHTNSSRTNAVISTEDASTSDVCSMFVDEGSVSKSRVSSKICKTTVCTHEPQKIPSKSTLGNKSRDVISSEQVSSSSIRGEKMTDELDFLNEVFTGNASKVGPCSANRKDPVTNINRLPSGKKTPKKADSNISNFIDSLIL